MKTHANKGVPRAWPAGASGRLAQLETTKQAATSTIDKSRPGMVRFALFPFKVFRSFRLKPEAIKRARAGDLWPLFRRGYRPDSRPAVTLPPDTLRRAVLHTCHLPSKAH